MSPIAVSALAKYIKKTLDMDYFLADIAVEGEISNVKNYPNGHCYFTLKDQAASIACILYRWDKENLGDFFREGAQVVARGGVSVYERESRIHFYVKEMEEKGQGALYRDVLKLKKKLEKEGLFKEDFKKPLPAYVSRIGVVTSKQGAVIQDIIHVARRRNKGVGITLYPCQVQGENAAKTIREALQAALKNKDLDVIILGRGGGSFEDLLAFQDEGLARDIFKADIPIISAVGHETDYSISDFVADLRAPTPSAAAELAVALKEDLVMDLDLKIRSGRQKIYNRLQMERSLLKEREGRLQFYSLDLVLNRKRLDLRSKLYRLEKQALLRLRGQEKRLDAKQKEVLTGTWRSFERARDQLLKRKYLLEGYSREGIFKQKRIHLAGVLSRGSLDLNKKIQGERNKLSYKKFQLDLILRKKFAGSKNALSAREDWLNRNFSVKGRKTLLEQREFSLKLLLNRLKQDLAYEKRQLLNRAYHLEAFAPEKSLKDLDQSLSYKLQRAQFFYYKNLQRKKADLASRRDFLSRWSGAFPRAYVLKDGRFIGGLEGLKKEDILKLYLSDGQADVRVEKVYKKEGDRK